MKHQKGFTVVEFLFVLIVICVIIPWPLNAYKLSECDFASPYKCEVMHGIGVFIPPLSVVTVWFDTDEE